MVGKTRKKFEELQTQFDRLSERIELILMLREPGTAQAADAYEGLRRQITSAVGTRQQYLVHLAQIDAALHAGESRDSLALLTRDLLNQAGLRRIDRAENGPPELFEVHGEGSGPLEVIKAAYVDEATMRIIVQGIARVRPGDDAVMRQTSQVDEQSVLAPDSGPES